MNGAEHQSRCKGSSWAGLGWEINEKAGQDSNSQCHQATRSCAPEICLVIAEQ